MKKIAMLLVAFVMTLSANAQFEQGKYYVGASLTGLDMNYNGLSEFSFGVNAKAGYFVADNLVLPTKIFLTWVQAAVITLFRMVFSWVLTHSLSMPAATTI